MAGLLGDWAVLWASLPSEVQLSSIVPNCAIEWLGVNKMWNRLANEVLPSDPRVRALATKCRHFALHWPSSWHFLVTMLRVPAPEALRLALSLDAQATSPPLPLFLRPVDPADALALKQRLLMQTYDLVLPLMHEMNLSGFELLLACQAESGNLPLVQALLRDSRHARFIEPRVLYDTACRGHAEVVAELLKEERFTKEARHHSLVAGAAFGNHLELFKHLTNDLQLQYIPLAAYKSAIAGNSLSVVKYMLERKLVSLQDRYDKAEGSPQRAYYAPYPDLSPPPPPIAVAFYAGAMDVIRYLLDMGVVVTAADWEVAWNEAIGEGHLAAVEFLWATAQARANVPAFWPHLARSATKEHYPLIKWLFSVPELSAPAAVTEGLAFTFFSSTILWFLDPTKNDMFHQVAWREVLDSSIKMCRWVVAEKVLLSPHLPAQALASQATPLDEFTIRKLMKQERIAALYKARIGHPSLPCPMSPPPPKSAPHPPSLLQKALHRQLA